MSVAERVAQERGQSVGHEVGYQVLITPDSFVTLCEPVGEIKIRHRGSSHILIICHFKFSTKRNRYFFKNSKKFFVFCFGGGGL